MMLQNGLLYGYDKAMRIAIIPTGRKRRPKIAMTPTTITIHNTGVYNVPADNFKRGCHDITQDMAVSYHFVIDEKEVIQLLPINEVAWHSGSIGNYNSIGIEICERDGAEENAIKFIAQLLIALNMTDSYIRTHKFWSGKECPRLILPHLDKFLKDVKLEISQQTRPKDVDKIKLKLFESVKEVEAINKNGYNYIKLRDLENDIFGIGYDAKDNLPYIYLK